MAAGVTYLPALCGNASPSWALWNDQITFNTSTPDFTACFHTTVLVYIPCFFFWISLPFYLIYLSRQRTLHRCGDAGYLNLIKVIIGVLLSFIALLNLFRTISDQMKVDYQPPAYYVAHGFYCVTYVTVTWLTHYECRKGQVSSGVSFIFWLLVLVCQTFSLRTYSMRLMKGGQFEDQFHIISFYLNYALIVLQFLFMLKADTSAVEKFDEWNESESEPLLSTSSMRIKGSSTSRACPESRSSFLSRITFWWITELILRGFKRPLVMNDLWNLNAEDRAANVYDKFQSHWRRELTRKRKHKPGKYGEEMDGYPASGHYTKLENPDEQIEKRKKASLFKALAKAFGWHYVLGGVYKLFSDGMAFVQPQFLGLIIAYVTSGDAYDWQGYALAVLLFLISMFRSLMTQLYSDVCYRTGLRFRSAMICAIYEKGLRLGAASKKNTTQGETVNLMSVDSQKLQDLPLFLHMIWSAPMIILGSMILLWQTLGPASLAGLFILILLIPINAYIARKVKILQMAQMRSKDNRLKVTNEVLNGIKVLKLYAWEKSFEDKIKGIREEELMRLKKIAYMNAVTSISWFIAPFLVAIGSFTVFVLSSPDNILTPEIAFVSLSYFNIMNFPLALLPAVIGMVVQANVSVGRIKRFLLEEELDEDNVEFANSAKYAVNIDNATFSWGKGEPNVLSNITLKIPDGKIVAVVGQVGAGKTSLISAVLGELHKEQGSVKIRGKVAYVPQQAWVMNATVQENILFGKLLRKQKYDRVIEACALEADMEILPGKDKTEIGDKGINLSGGQKQRVSLARAVYQNLDIYVLDDPLSAVDTHVGRHIFEQVIGPNGYLAGKTRILVTHSLTYLKDVDMIVCLDDGVISEIGTYKELLKYEGAFADFVKNYLQQEKEEDDSDVEGEAFKEELKRHLSTLSIDGISGIESDSESELNRRKSKGSLHNRRKMGSRSSMRSSRGSLTASQADLDQIKKEITASRSRLTTEEFAETGTVKWNIYGDYIKANGVGRSLVCLCFYIFFIGSSIGGNIWLSLWSDDPPPESADDTGLRDLRLGIYGLFGFSQAVGILGQSICIALGSISAARIFHHTLVSRILRSPMSFFDTTPTGRIMNRVSKDIDTVDVNIPMTMRIWMMTFAQVIGTLIIISISTPQFVIAMIPLGIMYYCVQRFYITASRQMKRIDSILRSPIYSHFGATIAGADSIRSYREQDRFIRLNEKFLDKNQMAYFANTISNRWLGISLECLGNIVILVAATLAVFSKDSLTAGVIGLSITYSLQVTGGLNYMVRMSCDMENYVVSVERISEYLKLPLEAPWVKHYAPANDWPSKGEVNFSDYGVRYRQGLDLVLKGVDFKIKAGEKVGIVGRTGAGKSSLTLSLFRILESAQGYISIDGEVIEDLGLHQLRSKLTIIPQDPVLFSGTLRSNLDPFERFNDAELWSALDLSHLKSFVATQPEKLYHLITEGGDNLSVGQCQLVCLARALLRRSKILVLDEATAAVDLETDELIQNTIRAEFRGCTVITIAHRLNTIMDYDRILVLDNGQVSEYDSPSNLLKNDQSAFNSMAREAGLI